MASKPEIWFEEFSSISPNAVSGQLADGSPGQSFLTSDTLASMSISYDHVDSFANEPFSWPQAMAKGSCCSGTVSDSRRG
jgi:hypothetical protein